METIQSTGIVTKAMTSVWIGEEQGKGEVPKRARTLLLYEPTYNH